METRDASTLAITVVDMQGRVVISDEEYAASGRYVRRLDVSHLPAGSYAVRVATSRGTAMRRFVKQ
jgi:hypothetical protein